METPNISLSAKSPPPASSPSPTSERGIESQVICLPFSKWMFGLMGVSCPLGTADAPSPLCRIIKLQI